MLQDPTNFMYIFVGVSLQAYYYGYILPLYFDLVSIRYFQI